MNPFLAPSELPYRLPDFARITDKHYRPAFQAAMAEQRAEVEAIVTAPDAVTFENTIVALERSGQALQRVSAVFFTLAGAHTSPVVDEIQAEVAPQLAAHRDAIALDPRLFARIRELFERRDELGLDPESYRLLERRHFDAVRAGAELGDADQQRLRELNAELSCMTTAFGTRLRAESNDSAVHVDDPARLDGLAAGAVSTAAAAAGTCSPSSCPPPSPCCPRSPTAGCARSCSPRRSGGVRAVTTMTPPSWSAGSPRCAASERACSGIRTTRHT